MKKKMTDEQKGKLISHIMGALKEQAFLLGKHFDEKIFFDLIFKTDDELLRIKRLCGL